MNHFLPAEPSYRRIRADGWTHSRRVTFCVTLAASGSVTFAAASAGLSRKSAYALKKRDPAFASLWDRSLSAAKAARREISRRPAQGNELPAAPDRRQSINFIYRHKADIAERDDFFAGLEAGLPVAFPYPRIGPPLAKNRKQSDAIILESACRSTCDSAPPANTGGRRVACPEQPTARG